MLKILSIAIHTSRPNWISRTPAERESAIQRLSSWTALGTCSSSFGSSSCVQANGPRTVASWSRSRRRAWGVSVELSTSQGSRGRGTRPHKVTCGNEFFCEESLVLAVTLEDPKYYGSSVLNLGVFFANWQVCLSSGDKTSSRRWLGFYRGQHNHRRKSFLLAIIPHKISLCKTQIMLCY